MSPPIKILAQSKRFYNDFRACGKFFIQLEFLSVQSHCKARAFARAKFQICKSAIHVVHDKPIPVASKISVSRVEGQADALRFIFRTNQNEFAALKLQFLNDGRFLHGMKKFNRQRQIFLRVDNGNGFVVRADKNFRRTGHDEQSRRNYDGE